MLKPETERAWDHLRTQPSLNGFVLVGGTALALQLRHRLSEDLDFLWPHDRLPVHRLDALRRVTGDLGWAPHDDPAAVQECESGGLLLRDFQQDDLVLGSVKVSFIAADAAFQKVFAAGEDQPLRLATLAELFQSKALLTARRSRSRDWFDLYVLMTRSGFTLRDFHAAFERAGWNAQTEVALNRLCPGTPPLADEGYQALAPGAPSLAVLQQFFRDARDHYEQAEAAARRRALLPPA
jgi:hypothetical protein